MLSVRGQLLDQLLFPVEGGVSDGCHGGPGVGVSEGLMVSEGLAGVSEGLVRG